MLKRHTIFSLLSVFLYIFIFSATGLAMDISDFPELKEGAWEIVDKKAGTKSRMCIDSATNRAFLAFGKEAQAQMDCDTSYEKNGDTYVTKARCNMPMIGGMEMVTTYKGDFNKGYTTETITKMDKPMFGMPATDKSVAVSTWKGPCKPGEKPGDMQIFGPNGEALGSMTTTDLGG